jgi:hypothetical protein
VGELQGEFKKMTQTENELLTVLHRRWIETRDPKDGDRFVFFVEELTKKDIKERFPSISINHD